MDGEQFQFLLGTLKTSPQGVTFFPVRVFQFLLGTLKTVGDFNVHILPTRFNSF